jgi:hypothetical protein
MDAMAVSLWVKLLQREADVNGGTIPAFHHTPSWRCVVISVVGSCRLCRGLAVPVSGLQARHIEAACKGIVPSSKDLARCDSVGAEPEDTGRPLGVSPNLLYKSLVCQTPFKLSESKIPR